MSETLSEVRPLSTRPIPRAEVIGTINLPSRALAIADTKHLDVAWTRGGHAAVAVEFEGPRAVEIGQRQIEPKFKVQQFGAEVLRVTCPDTVGSGMIADTAERFAAAENTPLAVSLHNTDGANFMVRDAARKGNGAGFAGTMVGMIANAVEVSVLRDTAGQVIELRLRAV